jgi:hypothetical protein
MSLGVKGSLPHDFGGLCSQKEMATQSQFTFTEFPAAEQSTQDGKNASVTRLIGVGLLYSNL